MSDIPQETGAELSGSLPGGTQFAIQASKDWIVLRVKDKITFTATRWMKPDVAIELGIALREIGEADRISLREIGEVK